MAIPWNKGIKMPPRNESWCRNISLTHKGKNGGNGFKNGHLDYVSRESRKKASQKMKGRKYPERSGEKCRFWKGGISIGKNRKEYIRFKTLERIARKKQANGGHNLGEWENLKAQYNWICPACGRKEPEIKLTEDHIIPLSKGGSNNIENIQPLCGICNSSKNIKIIKY